jgi:uncharacterized membrane protein YkvA (DUF1232 family)
MPWYGWVILLAGGLLAMAALTFRALRASRRGRRFLALPMRDKLRFGRLLLRDPEVGWPAKLTLVLLVGYLAMPFDLIPDFIPVIGQLDDIAISFAAIALLILAVPREQFERALARAELEAKEAAALRALPVDADRDA